jgi:hypothetical protein
MLSLGSDVKVSDITYSNIYTWSSEQTFMIDALEGDF